MPITKEAVLQAAATIASAKIQAGAVLSAAQGVPAAITAAKAGVDSTTVLLASINEVLKAVEQAEGTRGEFMRWDQLE